jgi:hypothetical protein
MLISRSVPSPVASRVTFASQYRPNSFTPQSSSFPSHAFELRPVFLSLSSPPAVFLSFDHEPSQFFPLLQSFSQVLLLPPFPLGLPLIIVILVFIFLLGTTVTSHPLDLH